MHKDAAEWKPTLATIILKKNLDLDFFICIDKNNKRGNICCCIWHYLCCFSWTNSRDMGLTGLNLWLPVNDQYITECNRYIPSFVFVISTITVTNILLI